MEAHEPAGPLLSSALASLAALDTGHAARLAIIHADGFARPWSTLEFERLLAERNVMADGLFLGQAPAPMGFVISRAVIDEAEILTVALAAEARGRGYARPLLRLPDWSPPRPALSQVQPLLRRNALT